MDDGLLAAFDGAEALLRAVVRARESGYSRIEAFTPYPDAKVEEAMRLAPSPAPRFALAGGIFGAIFGYAFQYYARVVAYPLNVGGRPVHAWPTFVPITFEMTILFSGLATFVTWLALSGLPRLYRPIFEIERFRAATVDGFFLAVDGSDPRFDEGETDALLREVGATSIERIGGAS